MEENVYVLFTRLLQPLAGWKVGYAATTQDKLAGTRAQTEYCLFIPSTAINDNFSILIPIISKSYRQRWIRGENKTL